MLGQKQIAFVRDTARHLDTFDVVDLMPLAILAEAA